MSKINYVAIRAAMDADTATFGTLTDKQAADKFNVAEIPVPRESIPGSELFGYTNAVEYAALTDAQKQQWLGLCAIDTITKDAVPLIKSLFPSGTITWGNIIKTEKVSRVSLDTDINVSRVREGDVKRARAL